MHLPPRRAHDRRSPPAAVASAHGGPRSGPKRRAARAAPSARHRHPARRDGGVARVRALAEKGITAVVAPSVAYGATDFAEGFAGAVSVPAAVLTALLRAIVERLRADGWTRVPGEQSPRARARRRRARRRAGRRRLLGRVAAHEALGSHAERRVQARRLPRRPLRDVPRPRRRRPRRAVRQELPRVGVNLAADIAAGRSRFRDIGMDRAYTALRPKRRARKARTSTASSSP